MFTWIPIHEETAKRLLYFRNRSRELAALVVRMHEKGLKALPANDKDKDGNTVPLGDIDPFTFLAGFNRAVRDDNRKALWHFLKDEWNLASPVPEDFDGLPVANLQNSWMFPYEKDRKPDHLPLLWEFFEHIMSVAPSDLDAGLMDRCLAKPGVGLAFLTMGMFWACPKKWIATDGKNLGFAATKGVTDKLRNAVDYIGWLPKIQAVIGGDGVEFSRQAHLWATQVDPSPSRCADPFDKLFPKGDSDLILDHYKRLLEILDREVDRPGNLLSITLRQFSSSHRLLRINVWRWIISSLEARPDRRTIGALLPVDHREAIRDREERKQEDRRLSDGFDEAIDGTTYIEVIFSVDDFFQRYDELWPDIERSFIAFCRYFSSYKGSPYLRFHRPELEELIRHKEQRSAILAKGISLRKKLDQPPLGTRARRYWLIAPGEGAKYWDDWLKDDQASIGWHEIGDFSQYGSKPDLTAALDEYFPNADNGKVALMLENFSQTIREGDVLFAKLGVRELLGWGEVRGEYFHDGGRSGHPNLLPVMWATPKAVKLPEGLKLLPQKALTDITDNTELLGFLAREYVDAPGLKRPLDFAGDGDPD